MSQATYTREPQRSRISLSPFGYGEISWRDFDSFLAGALLMKPSMDRVETAPDLFVPGETYAPVAWDYSDLAELAARYLGDDPLRRRIAEQARDRLLAVLSGAWFADRFEESVVRPLARAGSGVGSGPRPRAPSVAGVRPVETVQRPRHDDTHEAPGGAPVGSGLGASSLCDLRVLERNGEEPRRRRLDRPVSPRGVIEA